MGKHGKVEDDKKVNLADSPTRVKPLYTSKDDYKKQLQEHVRALSHHQAVLFAQKQYALLLIFQAMDAAGKDGAIKHVMSGIDPSGCQVFSFKRPSMQELAHDFLWRTVKCLPERGRIGIFNRSYYEEVLVVRVHPEYLPGQNLPRECRDPDKIWKWRYQSIRDHEKHLSRSGTRIMKFFLHVSQEEQAKRLLARIDDEEKNWKMEINDVREREHWDDYMKAYEECIEETHSKEAPWFIIPADDKLNARLMISRAILNELDHLHLEFPRATPEHKRELEKIRHLLAR